MFKRIKKIFNLVLDDIAEFFPYFFIFYLICLLLSFLNKSWQLFFNWFFFLSFILLFGVLSLLSSRFRKFLETKTLISLKNDLLKKFFNLSVLLKNIIRNMGWRSAVKLSILVLVVALIANLTSATPIDLLVLIYALMVLLFSRGGKLAIKIVLFLLTVTAFVLWLGFQALAEWLAVYVYYFLTITVLYQVKGFLEEIKK